MKKLKVWQLVSLLILVVVGALLFVGGVAGWFFEKKVEVEYLCEGECGREYIDLTPEEYEQMIREHRSFVVMVDQGGCTTADRLREYVLDFASYKGIKVFRISFEEMKDTTLHEYIKYYPSVGIISDGKVVGWLRADLDEDAPAYNNYEDFVKWIDKFLK